MSTFNEKTDEIERKRKLELRKKMKKNKDSK